MTRKTLWLLIAGLLALGGLAMLAIVGVAAFFYLHHVEIAGGPDDSAARAARALDSRWKPSCSEIAQINPSQQGLKGELRSFFVDAQGNLLVSIVAPEGAAQGIPDGSKGALAWFSPDGKLLKALPLDLRPNALAQGPGGTIFVGGSGRLLKLDPNGKVLASADSPVASLAVTLTPELEEMARESAKHSNRPAEEELARMKSSLEDRRTVVASLAATDRDVFVALPAPQDFTWRAYRFDSDLTGIELVTEKLRGCCGEMNVASAAGDLWIAHNGRHRVERLDRQGKEVAHFGKHGKIDPADFGGCCEPKNLRILASGDILAGESGPPTCIKRFSATGQFLEVLAVTDSKGDCVRMTVDASPDGTRFYLLDMPNHSIRVFAKKN